MEGPHSSKPTLIGRGRTFVRRRPVVSTIAAVSLVGAGAWLIFGFFAFQTLFTDESVSEANPFAAGAGPSGLPEDATTEAMATAMNDAMAAAGKTGDEVVDEPMSLDGVTTVVAGSFISRSHPTTGTAEVITDGTRRFLRFEGFETDNGPDLNVYLATGDPDGPPGDFVDLGDLKGNVGNQNYELSADIDIERCSTVFIWCVRFGVAFGAAPLS